MSVPWSLNTPLRYLLLMFTLNSLLIIEQKVVIVALIKPLSSNTAYTATQSLSAIMSFLTIDMACNTHSVFWAFMPHALISSSVKVGRLSYPVLFFSSPIKSLTGRGPSFSMVILSDFFTSLHSSLYPFILDRILPILLHKR